MAFDDSTRKRLAKIVAACRARLVTDITEQLQSSYGLYPDGSILDVAITEDDRQAAADLRALLDHFAAIDPGKGASRRVAAYGRLVREIGFTILNRLAALRLCEERGLVVECVRQGMSSAGFQLYDRVAGGALGDRYATYRAFLEGLFDELALDLGVLFDRSVPQSLVFPTEPALVEVLDQLNDRDLAALRIWQQDETIGWIYQYYNDPTERKKMRDESAAPRNSRELAVRNQFFTPRYVVEFLTDNTLGRMWYEMRRGETRLAEQCRYLVRRPDEVFLGAMFDEVLADGNPDALFIAGKTDEIPPFRIPSRSWLPPVDRSLAREIGAEIETENDKGDEDPFNNAGSRLIHFAHFIGPFNWTEHAQRDQWFQTMRKLTERPRFPVEGATQELWSAMLAQVQADRQGMGLHRETQIAGTRIANEIRHRLLAARADDGASREEGGAAPTLVFHRPLKDPRDLRILDPACGSGHFLLYAFDLLATIYEEAWLDRYAPQAEARPEPYLPESEVTGRTLTEDYPDFATFRRAIPGLILRHNLHGIDIDPRAVQIAALALWLRAQRAYKDLRVSARERPPIIRTNIVTAEPMPGDRALLDEFVRSLQPPELGDLVRFVFDRMQLAGEVGSLLKIEEELAERVEILRKRVGPIFATGDFWDNAEREVLDALQRYAALASNGQVTRRRLFAEDAEQGFAFVDLCRQKYDVVLMNPPFGEVSLKARAYLYRAYENASQDILSAFVDNGVDRTISQGFVGAITSRLGFFLELLESWRWRLFGGRSSLITLADLGYGVLDDALVEAAAYVVQVGSRDSLRAAFVSVLDAEDKAQKLLDRCAAIIQGRPDPHWHSVDLQSFTPLPAKRASYWVSDSWRRMFQSTTTVESKYGFPLVGLQTGDDELFLRLYWEVPVSLALSRVRWITFAKGGEYSPFFGDFHLMLDWSQREQARRQSNAPAYFKPGITYTERTTSNLSARVLPPGCVFSPNGVTIPARQENLLEGVAFLNTRVCQFLVEMCVGSGDAVHSGSAARHYGPRILGSIPAPPLSSCERDGISALVTHIWSRLRDHEACDEVSRYFVSPYFLSGLHSMSLRHLAHVQRQAWEFTALDAIDKHFTAESMVLGSFGIDDERYHELIEVCGVHPHELPSQDELSATAVQQALSKPIDEIISDEVKATGASRSLTKKTYVVDRQLELLSLRFKVHPKRIVEARQRTGRAPTGDESVVASSALAYCVGASFGRWDLRIAFENSSSYTLPGPFDPLPACPPGVLVGPDGLPATPGRIVSEAWLRARPNAITLPPAGAVAHPTIPDAEYPIPIAWDSILVDDPHPFEARPRAADEQPHPSDIVRRVRDVLALLWPENSHAIEAEACEILGVKELRDYFRKPGGFFADHLKRYSKSRRQAPIYWPLSTVSGSYTLWVYYHRLTDQTLYTAVNQYLNPKIAQVEGHLARLADEMAHAQGRRATDRCGQVDAARSFRDELVALRDELLRVAQIPYRPNLNDGVIINAAPLHRMFRLSKWARDTEATWEKLQTGDYDWAHLAYTLWPDRVREVCKTNKSIAIAHGLEHLYQEAAAAQAKRAKRKAPVEDEDDVDE